MKIRHEHIFPIGHPGERNAHFARDEPVDVVWEVCLKIISEAPAQVEGGVEDTHLPAPGTSGDVHEDLRDDVWGAGDKHTKDCATPAMAVLCGKTRTPGGKEAASLLPGPR